VSLFGGCSAVSAIAEAISACSEPRQLDEAARLVWTAYGEGAISEYEASLLSEAIDARRPPRPANGRPGPLAQQLGRLSRFLPRRRQHSPDRKASRDRRRMLGGSSALPDNLRHHYTEGQRAVLCVVVGEVKRHGTCEMPIDKIAALAGVCRTTVQNAMHEARRLGHVKITERPQRGRKNLPNVIEIASPEWRAWIKRAPSAARLIGSKMAKLVSPTKNTARKKEAAADKVVGWRGCGPPMHSWDSAAGRGDPAALSA
jgi:hypothetical protein